MTLTVGSLFSGIGGLDLGLERAGMEIRWQVEIDEFCQCVLEKHWPNVKRYGDIREVTGDELEPVDLICGGFPCQDVSMAGKRAGLAGERSGLWWEFHRIINTLTPHWVLIENVPGLLSSNKGWDFKAIIDSLVKLGYRVAWRVLDAQYFGVAQRRRRVFIVGCLGNGRCAAEVLFEPESVYGNPPNGKGKRQVVASLLASGAGTSRTAGIESETDLLTRTFANGGADDNKAQAGFIIPAVTNTLRAGAGAPKHEADLTRLIASRQLGVRRLIPRECERLQGFPDDWTLVDGATPDTSRYRALGNAVCVNVAEWIGQRIMEAEHETRMVSA